MKKWWLVICLIFIYTIPLISAQEKPIIITKMFLVSTKDGRKNWGITF